MSNVGRIFVDYKHGTQTGDYITYAVGKTGFLNLDTGDFTEYDSAFTGPEFFDNKAFIRVYVEW